MLASPYSPSYEYAHEFDRVNRARRESRHAGSFASDDRGGDAAHIRRVARAETPDSHVGDGRRLRMFRRLKKTTIRDLVCFAQAAATKSFARAAEQLNATPSAVSASIAQLESDLEVKLFDRTSARLVLTSVGAGLLPIAERLVKDFDLTLGHMQAVAGGERGHIRIVTSPSVAALILAPAISDFIAHYPHVSFAIHNATIGETGSRVLSGDADVGFSLRRRGEAGLAYRPIARDRLMFACRPGHPLAQSGAPVSWSMLRGYPYIAATDSGELLTQDDLRSALPKPKHEVSTVTLLPYVLDDAESFSIVPGVTRINEALSGFRFRDMAEPSVERTICVVTRRGREIAPAVRNLLRHVERRKAESSTLPSA
jgi:DNA-binding transcriptional LysR family regulator